MTKEQLEAIFDRVRSRPSDKQEQALEVLEWLDECDDVYELSEEERAGIERGLNDIKLGRFATDEEMAELFKKYRRRSG